MSLEKLDPRKTSPEISPEDILQDPNFFLQKIDPATKTLQFVQTTRDILSSAAFIDGRSDLGSTTEIYSVDMAVALKWHQETIDPATINRFIFHMSFCGSTLLARSCDRPGKAFSYKEPQALIDLATIKARQDPSFTDPDLWKNLIAFTLRQFRVSFAPGEVSLIKPSNWINSMLPDLCHDQKASKAIFMTLTPRQFLIAVLRGGRERIAYTCNFLMHLQTAFPDLSHWIEQAAPLNSDPLQSATRLILTAYYMQNMAYERVISSLQEGQYRCLSYDDLLAQPEESLDSVSTTLDLNFQPEDVTHNIDTVFRQYSKNSQENYDLTAAQKNNQKIEREYDHVIIPALTWYHENLAD